MTWASDAVDVQKLEASPWWTEVQKDIREKEYEITCHEETGAYHAANRAADLRAFFRAYGVELMPRTDNADWLWSFELTSFGRDGALEPVENVDPYAEGRHAQYRHEGITEWYVNRDEGFEQGFTVYKRPEGPGALIVEGHVSGGLEASLDADGQSVTFLQDGEEVLIYGKLRVEDADGNVLTSRLTLEGDRLRVVVEDDGRYPIYIDPLLTTPTWMVESDQESALFGWSVSSAGDVNGDSYDDVIVGAFLYDNGEEDEGRAYVYHGSASGLSTTPDWTAEGDRTRANFGYSVSSAGDVNGDSFDDVIVGARWEDNGYLKGRALVYHGSASGLSTTPDWSIVGSQLWGEFGHSVSSAGDVNGDSYDDVIVGENFYTNGQPEEGRAYVYHGSASGLHNAAAWTAESNQASANFGVSVSSAGDVNGDSYDDVVVGARWYDNGQSNEGRAYVYHGSASGLHTTADWTAESDLNNAWFGQSVSSAGDVNGDSYEDVIVGAPQYAIGQPYEGGVFVYHGSPTGLSSTPNWTTVSEKLNAYFGYSVSSAGDVNGDSHDDVIVGAPGHDIGQPYDGGVFVYYGSDAGLPSTPNWTTESEQYRASLGRSVSSAGDVNGDSYDDVIVGAPGYDNGQSNEGRAYVYHGSDTGVAVTIQAFESHWADNHVEVTWRLIEKDASPSFKIFRRKDADVDYVRIQNPEIIRQEDEYVFKDRSTERGKTYGYRVDVLEDGRLATSFETSLTTPLMEFTLDQNHPNPFNPTTEIGFSLDREKKVSLQIYDITGKHIRTLVNRKMTPGSYSESWDGRDNSGNKVASGIYFFRLTAGNRTLTRKGVLLK